MTPLRFGFAPAAPEGWLAFQRLPQVLVGHSVVVEHLPLPGLPAPPKAMSPAMPTVAELADLARGEGLSWPAHGPLLDEAEALLGLLWAAAPPGRGPSRQRCALLLEALWPQAAAADPAARRARLQAALGLDAAAAPQGGGHPAGQGRMPCPPHGVPVGRPWLQPLAGPLAGRIFVGLAGQDALAAALGEAGQSA